MDKKRRVQVISATVLITISAVLANVVEPLLLERFFGSLMSANIDTTPNSTSSNHAFIIRIKFYVFVAALIGNQIIKRAYDLIIVKHQNQMAESIYSMTSGVLLHKDYTFYRMISETGSLQSKDDRFCIAYFELQNTFNHIFLSSFVMVVGMIIVLSLKLPMVGLLIGIWLFFYLFGLYFLLIRKYILDRLEAQANSRMKAYFQDVFANIYSILHSGIRKSEHARYVARLKKFLEERLKTTVHNVVLYTFQGGMSILLTISLIAFLIPQFHKGQINVTDVILVVLYTTRLTQNFWNLGGGIISVVKNRAQMEEMISLLDHRAKIAYVLDEDKHDLSRKTQNINAVEFKGVTFSYESDDIEYPQNLFSNFDFSIKKGQQLAIVGTTGAGKSTLVELLLRQIDPEKGSVIVNGNNIKDYSERQLTDFLTHMPQEPTFFNDTIAENVQRHCNQPVSDEILNQSLESVHLSRFVANLKDGVDTIIGEKALRLSGGQKQKLALARVFAKVLLCNKADGSDRDLIIILDEPTSALDQETERNIKGALDQLHKNSPFITLIVIAHRLESIRGFDQIVVLKNGSVVEQGTHSELLALSGEYSHLWELKPQLQEGVS